MDRKTFLSVMAALPLLTKAMNLDELKNITDSFSDTIKMPVFFVGHGSPMNALEQNPFTHALNNMGKTLSLPPTAILVVSAHWLTEGSFVCATQQPKTIHDFGGFPQALFDMTYPAPGSPKYAHAVEELAPEIKEDNDWGLDHGAWTILKHMFPDASVPVFQVSIDFGRPMEYHFHLAQKLKKLRDKGVLIIGSGNIVHNLRMSMDKLYSGDKKAYDWAIEFDTRVKESIDKRDFDSLINYSKLTKGAALAVPTTDHYIPLLYSLALADANEEIVHTYESVEYGGMSMRTLRIGKA